MQLRIAGATFAQIGAELGITPKAAEKAIIAGLRAYFKEPAQDLLALELQRLDRMTIAIWEQVVAGDIQAVLAMLKIQERRAKYAGLDAPTKTDARIAAYHEVNIGSGEGVLTIKVGEDVPYLDGLRAMRGEPALPAIEGSSRTPTDVYQDDDEP